MNDFEKELKDLINIHGIDSMTDTSDYILAEYLVSCINGYLEIVLTKRQETIDGEEAEWKCGL